VVVGVKMARAEKPLAKCGWGQSLVLAPTRTVFVACHFRQHRFVSINNQNECHTDTHFKRS